MNRAVFVLYSLTLPGIIGSEWERLEMDSNTQQRIEAISLREVAEVAGVSSTTASLALSGKGNVSEKTRRKVIDVANKLGYKKTEIQKKAQNEQLYQIGLCFCISTSSSHNWRFLRSFIENCQQIVLEKEGNFLLFPYSQDLSAEENATIIKKTGVRGIISFSFYEEPFLTQLEEEGISVVVFNNQAAVNKFSSVAIDDFQSSYEAVSYLIGLGHRNILYVHTERQNLPILTNNRYLGYMKALAEQGIPYQEDYAVHFDTQSSRVDIESFQRLMSISDPPTAALCMDDDIAAGLLVVLERIGYSIPNDLSVIAHGDMLDYSRLHIPQITTMRMDPLLSCKVAVNMLIEQLESSKRLLQVLRVPENMVDRGSCIPVPHN